MAAEDACEGLASTDPGAEQAALRPHRQGHHGMSPRGAPWGWRGCVSSTSRVPEAPSPPPGPRAGTSPSCHQVQLSRWAPASVTLALPAQALMTGQPRATRPRTQRGLGSAPTSCLGAGSARRGEGRHGGGVARTLLPLGRGRKEAGRANNVRKRLFTRGRSGLPSPAPGCPQPSGHGALVPLPREAAGGHGEGRDKRAEPHEAAGQAWPA